MALTFLAIAMCARSCRATSLEIRDGSTLIVICLGFISISAEILGVTTFGVAGHVAPASLTTALAATMCAIVLIADGHPAFVALLMQRGQAGSLARALLFSSLALPLVLAGIAGTAAGTAS